MKTNLLLAAVVSAGLFWVSPTFAELPDPPVSASPQASTQKPVEKDTHQGTAGSIEDKEKSSSTDKEGHSLEGTQTEPTPGKPGKVKSEPLLDRRWIMKFRDQKGKLSPKKEEPIPWESEEQENRCLSHLSSLRETFRQTRYFSVHGDACNTGRFAKRFLETTEICLEECPEGFLGKMGYSSQIIRNVSVLHRLGQKRCLEPVIQDKWGPGNPEKKAAGEKR